MPREDNLEALIEIAEQLGPTNRRRFLLFLNSVRSLYRHYRSYKEERGPD